MPIKNFTTTGTTFSIIYDGLNQGTWDRLDELDSKYDVDIRDSSATLSLRNPGFSDVLKVGDTLQVNGVDLVGTFREQMEALKNQVLYKSGAGSSLPTETLPTYAAMTASISSDSSTKRDFFVSADETNGGAKTRYSYDGTTLNNLQTGKGLLPRGITGCVAAWHCQDINVSNGTISQFNDVTGNGYHLTQSNTAKQWTYDLNGAIPPSSPIGYDFAKPLTIDYRSATVIWIGGRRTTAGSAGGALILPTGTSGGILFENGAGFIHLYGSDRYAGQVFDEAMNGLSVAYSSTATEVGCNSGFYSANVNNAATVNHNKMFTYEANTGLFSFSRTTTTCLIFNRALSKREVLQIFAFYGVSQLREKNIVYKGDSITAGVGTTDVIDSFATVSALNIGASKINAGISGGQVSGLSGENLTGTNNLFIKGRENILVFFEGDNDLAGNIAVATLQTNYQNYCTARKTYNPNWKIIACTILPRNASFSGGQTAAGYETARNTFNTWLRTNYRTFADELADFAANGTIGVQSAADNTTYYGDKIHPTVAGHAILASILQDAVTRLYNQFIKLTTAQRDALTNLPVGYRAFITDATATDASTGVLQTWNGSAWKNAW